MKPLWPAHVSSRARGGRCVDQRRTVLPWRSTSLLARALSHHGLVGVDLENQRTARAECISHSVEQIGKRASREGIELAEQQHDEVVPRPEIGVADIGAHVGAAEVSLGGDLFGILDRGRRDVDTETRAPARGESLGVEARTAAQIENGAGPTAEDRIEQPLDVGVDGLEPAARMVVSLVEVLPKHPAAEFGVMPRDLRRAHPVHRRPVDDGLQ